MRQSFNCCFTNSISSHNSDSQELNKHDKEPAKYVKQWRGIKPKTGAPYSCDIDYEWFLGPVVFFNPEICSSDFTTPLPNVIDKCIQSAPIDTRRALYKDQPCSRTSTEDCNETSKRLLMLESLCQIVALVEKEKQAIRFRELILT